MQNVQESMKLRIVDKDDMHETRADRARWPAIFISMMVVSMMVVMGFYATISAQAYASPDVVDLGTSGDFAILAQAGISSTGTTHIWGDIGVSPIDSTAISGNFALTIDSSNQFSTSALVTGHAYAADYAVPTPTKVATAVADMMTAYNNASGRTPNATELGAGDITTMTLAPGCYYWSSNLLISAAGVTLSGTSIDVWIFQIAGDLNLANGAHVYLSGGAVASHIFWQVAGQATLGTTSVMKGVILCLTAIVMNTGATLDGRALAQTAVTLDSNLVKTTEYTFVGDGAPPQTTLAALIPATPSGEQGWYKTDVSMNLTAIDFGTPSPVGVNTTEYRINGGAWMNYSTTGMNVTIDQSGVNSTGFVRIDYRSWDHDGNVEPFNTRYIKIDELAPTTTGTMTSGTAGSNGWFTSSMVGITLTAADAANGSGLNWTAYRNGTSGSFIKFNYTVESVTLSYTGDGTRKIEVYSVDNATNVETNKNVSVNIDTVAPTLAITQANGTSFASATPGINWTAADATSGLDHFEVSIDGGAATTVNGTELGTVLSSLTNGQHNVTVKAVDVAGNSMTKTVTITVSAAGDNTLLILAIVAGIIIAAAIAATMMMMRRKGKGKDVSEEELPSK
jgi:predicted RNA-binding protein with TRAM domain